MIDIDFAEAQRLVSECIAEKGADYVYENEGTSCKYVHDVADVWDDELQEYVKGDLDKATPGCIVGHAFHKAGVSLARLGASDRNDEGSFSLIEKLGDEEVAKVTSQAANYLANLQASQDIGAPWGVAHDAALRGMQMETVWDKFGDKTGEFVEVEGADVK